MQTILVSKDGIRVWLVAFALAVGFLGFSRPAEAQEASEIETGVVMEGVGEGSALEKAGLQAGDVVFSWERLPSPPANPQEARGAITSVFDWMWLVVEQAPRGTVKLTGQRDGEVEVFEVVPGEWEATLRPRIPKGILEVYIKGKELIETEELEAGIDLWHKVVAMAENQAADGCFRCWLLLRIGDAWGQARQWKKAHAAYRSALEAAQDPLIRVAIWRAIGYAYQTTSDFETAREAYGAAQEIRESTWGESLAFAGGLNDLGVPDWGQGRLDAAQGYWQRGLEIRQKLAPGSLDVAGSLGNLGALVYYRGDLDQAAEYFEEALEITQQLAPGSREVARHLNSLGNVASERSDLNQAAEYHRRSLEILKKVAPGSLTVAHNLNNLGALVETKGDLDQAIEYLEGALEIRQKLAPGSRGVAASLGNLGAVASARGDLDRAAQYLEKALEIELKLAPDSLEMASLLSNLGHAARARGDWGRAIEYYERSLKIRQKSAPGSISMAKSLEDLGVVAFDRGDLDRSGQYHEKALKIFQALTPGSLVVANGLNNLGAVAHERGDLARAAEYYEKSMEIMQNLAPGSLVVATCLHNLGVLASDRGDLDRAAEYHKEALEIRQRFSPGSSAEAGTLHSLASLYRAQNQPQPALAFFRQALQTLENQVDRLGGSRAVQASFRAKRVAYYRDTINLSVELRQAEEAFHILERYRAQSFLAQLAERDLVFSNVPEELERQRRSIAHGYDQTQDEIAQLNPEDQGEEIEALRDQLQLLRWEHADLTEKIIKASPRLGALRYPQSLDFAAAQKALDPGTVMLSYSVGQKSTEIFVLTSEGDLHVETIAIGEEDLRSKIRTWNELIPTARPGDETGALYSVRSLGKRLYQQLIEPGADAVAGSQRLLIIPDGPLHVLPWGALIRETETAGEMYLAEWKPLHTVLSATVYAQLKQSRHPRSKAGEKPAPIALAAFGDPLFPGKGESHGDFRVRSAVDRGLFDDWDSLRFTRREVQQIAALYPTETTRTYLGTEATEEAVKAVGRGARILHLATHGHLDDRSPLDSAIVLTIPQDPGTDRDNGLLQVWEIFERVRLDADLVVLSACASGVGEEQVGEGLIGLTRAFQYAGARSVVASLWNVQDQATAELMVRFYRHLTQGLSKDEALRAAQLELIRGGIEMEDEDGETKVRDYSAPYYWAPFQVYGDWQ